MKYGYSFYDKGNHWAEHLHAVHAMIMGVLVGNLSNS